MKILVILFMAISCAHAMGQSAELVDEMTNPNCETLASRLDYIAGKLLADPKSSVYVGVTASRQRLRDSLVNEQMMRYSFARRGLSNRAKIIRTGVAEELKFKIFLATDGQSAPLIIEQGWSYLLSTDTKPFIFAWGESDATDVCPLSDPRKLLAEVLQANPAARINLVIHANSVAQFALKRRTLARELLRDYGISRNRVRFFRQRNGNPAFQEGSEYWLVP